MQIGIVEDEIVWRDKIKRVIETYLREHNALGTVKEYTSGSDCLQAGEFDLIFMDIELGDGENGFHAAEQLIHSGSQCKICFITSHTELARDGYKYNAFRYIDKLHLEEIEEALESFLRTKIQERMIPCSNGAGICIRVYLKDILFIETNERKLRYVMLDGSECYSDGNISELAGRLCSFGFYHIQRSYIINLKYIEELNSREVTLTGGKKVTIGRVHSKGFKKEFFRWRMLFDE